MMLAARHVETSDVPAQVALYLGCRTGLSHPFCIVLQSEFGVKGSEQKRVRDRSMMRGAYFGSMSESPPEYRVSAMGVERCRNRTRHCSPSSAKYMASAGLNARAQEVVTGAPL